MVLCGAGPISEEQSTAQSPIVCSGHHVVVRVTSSQLFMPLAATDAVPVFLLRSWAAAVSAQKYRQ